jgi:nucleoside-diphosphate-sugar epimerase
VLEAVAHAQPDVIVHQLTSLAGALDMRHFDRGFALTNRLRTEGTDHLLSAGRAIGVRRFVAQSFTSWPYARTGAAVKSEEDPLDATPPKDMQGSMDAIRYLERAVLEADWTEGVVLRYGGFYGPGTSLRRGGEMTQLIRRRRIPLIGDGAGVWSFIHIEDAAEATAIAVERGRPGIYNVVDDEPATVAEWLPALAAAAGAKAPRRVPRWLARALAGEVAVVMMTEIRGASNQKAKQELAWQPAHASWRRAFVQELA